MPLDASFSMTLMPLSLLLLSCLWLSTGNIIVCCIVGSEADVPLPAWVRLLPACLFGESSCCRRTICCCSHVATNYRNNNFAVFNFSRLPSMKVLATNCECVARFTWGRVITVRNPNKVRRFIVFPEMLWLCTFWNGFSSFLSPFAKNGNRKGPSAMCTFSPKFVCDTAGISSLFPFRNAGDKYACAVLHTSWRNIAHVIRPCFFRCDARGNKYKSEAECLTSSYFSVYVAVIRNVYNISVSSGGHFHAGQFPRKGKTPQLFCVPSWSSRVGGGGHGS